MSVMSVVKVGSGTVLHLRKNSLLRKLKPKMC